MSNGNRGRTEVITEVVFLGKLIEQIAAGKVRIPRFQRPFVWKQEDLHQLLDSVLRGIPIGSILMSGTQIILIESASNGSDQSKSAPPPGGQ